MVKFSLLFFGLTAANEVHNEAIAAAGENFLREVLQEGRLRQNEKYTVITDAGESSGVTQKQEPQPEKPEKPDAVAAQGEVFVAVGSGRCANVDRVKIHASTTLYGTQDRNTLKNAICEEKCGELDECVGYNSMEAKCELIHVSDKRYNGGIASSDERKGVLCFRKRDAPFDPVRKSGWESFGKLTFSIIFISGVAIGILALMYYALWFFFPGGVTPA